ncbi:MAG: glutamine--fructose-6-phosphate transaminase (isomerizing) [Halobacteriales archaeon]
MCGIVGYVGERPALAVLVDGIERLEYRGYDSAGICLRADPLEVYKRAGDVSDLREVLPESASAVCGVGHTRWSTHGEPTDYNAHPHVDETSRHAVVHNGIIENHESLRRHLEGKGHEFESDTDTEVVPHLLEEAEGSLFDRVRAAVEELEGSYAVACVSSEADEVVVARNDSPLVVGLGDDANYVASDVTAFVEHTKDVVYLEDGDVARLNADSVEIWNAEEGEDVERDVETVDWDVEDAERGGYPHYMLKEIHEQPEALRRAIAGRVDEVEGEVSLEVDVEDYDDVERVEVVACGTSYHAGMYARRLVERHVDVPVSVEHASEYLTPISASDTLVVAVTQSGETADTLAAMRRASRAGAKTLAVTNTVGSTAAREADDVLYIHAGPEIGVAATKTFASQVAVLTLLDVAVARSRGGLSAAEAAEVLEDVRGLPAAVQRALDREDDVEEIARRHVDDRAYFYVGRSLGYPVALEGALKMKEISYDHAEGYPAGELKHGPLALVDDDTLVVAVSTRGTRPEDTRSNVREVASRGAPVLAVTSDEETARIADETLDVPTLGDLEPLVANVYLQLLAYHVAALQDRSIDRPRNLAKSVTVE